MNRPTVSLIARRELRDLIRDRRSVTLLVVLPLLLYPGFGLVGYLMAQSQMELQSVIGVTNADQLRPDSGPALLDGDHFNTKFAGMLADPEKMRAVPLPDADRAPLDGYRVDAILDVPADFAGRLGGDEPVTLQVLGRDGDEVSKLAVARLVAVLRQYEAAVKQLRFARHNLPADFDRPLVVKEPRGGENPMVKALDESRDLFARLIPFMLVMWTLAGALHPAIDLCAGEKERGTMETLLISPAKRSEIVAGKFLAVWAYATATAWWNLLWMGVLCVLGNVYLQTPLVSWTGLAWCFALVLPLSALFSSLCLAIGVYARSTKEGQYYLLPLFLAALPLVAYSLMPGVELTLGTSLVPVTGVCLLVQKLLGPVPALALPYVAPVLLSLGVTVVLAAWWAVWQFHREGVLFRESEGSVVRGWLAGFGAPESQRA